MRLQEMEFPFEVLRNNEFDVVGFGTNAIDYLIRVPEYPVFNSKVEITNYVQAAGGEVASSLVGLSRLGLKTTYVGRFGGDQAGALGIKSLIEEGVDTTYSETMAGAATQIAFIIIDEQSGERTVLWQRDPGLAYTPDDAPIDIAGRGRLLHITPHDTAACIRIASSAKERGVIVSLDIDNIFDGVEELLPLVDVCIGSSDFTEKLLGISDKKNGLREISARFGCPVAGVTLGREGSLFYCQNTMIETPGFDVPNGCIDTTGAGDAFRAGFLYGLLADKSIEDSAAAANAVAALKCDGIGARSTLPTLNEMNSLLDINPSNKR